MKANLLVLLLLSAALFSATKDEAQAAFDAGNYANAQTIITDVVNAQPEDGADAGVYRLAAEIEFKMDELTQASGYLKKAIEIDGKNEEYRVFWDKLYEINSLMVDGKRSVDSYFYDEAVASYDSVITKYPDFALSYYWKGMVFKQQEDYSTAIENFQLASDANPHVEKYQLAILSIVKELVNIGNDHFRRRDYDEAIASYREALKYKPDFIEASFRLGYALYKTDDLAGSEQVLETGLKTTPDHYTSWKLLGDVKQKLSKTKSDSAEINALLEAAIESYSNAVMANPNYDKAYYAKAMVLNSNGRKDESVQELKLATQVNPEYAKAWELLGTLYNEMEKYDDAIDCFSNAVKSSDKKYKKFVHYYRMSEIYNLQKNYSMAKESAETAIDLKDNYAPAWFELGLAEKCLGNEAAAKFAFENSGKDKQWRKPSEFQLEHIDKPCED